MITANAFVQWCGWLVTNWLICVMETLSWEVADEMLEAGRNDLEPQKHGSD